MSRQGSLDLLYEVDENLRAIKESNQIKPVKVKSILEHLRSALEYVANDSYDKCVYPPDAERPKIYFPYGKKEFIDKFFRQRLKINEPTSSPLYDIFIGIQDYNTDQPFLEMMCGLTNEVKHRQPIPFEEEKTVKDISVNIGGLGLLGAGTNSTIIFKNNVIDGIKIEDFRLENGNLEKSGNGYPVNLVITEEKKIRFHGMDYEVIPFLELCLSSITNFVNNAYDILESI